MKINAGEIRVGMLLEYRNDLWQVLKTQHVKPGKGGAFAQVEMKSVNKNTKLNERFRSSETVEKATLEEQSYNYLYEDENKYFFMDHKTFEQIEINKDIVSTLVLNNIQKKLQVTVVKYASIQFIKNGLLDGYQKINDCNQYSQSSFANGIALE